MAGVLPAESDKLYSSETEPTDADEICFLRRAVEPNNSEKFLVAKPSSTDDKHGEIQSECPLIFRCTFSRCLHDWLDTPLESL